MASTYYASNRYEAATGATAYTTAAQYAADYLGRPAVAEPDGYDITCPFFFGTVVLTTPHLFVVNDVVRLAKIPKGAVIVDYSLFLPSVDSGTTLALHSFGLLNAGIGCFAASSIGGRSDTISTITPQTTTVTTVTSAPATTVVGALPYAEINTAVATQSDGGDVLALKAIAAGSGAGAGGVIHGWVKYIIRPYYFDSIKNAS